ncbi:Spx/MgsR family RNA polymerase-binding regulatory protein [Runella sp. MFBS21]|uniref:Spx/MgsR family RNA polymerase-binding regulatory protein n=1 Tax=Runella sp. MFBS21 TaxID=3034018 RepID=UPI0023F677BF|nr:Spx/MgsR family RNA polymerase-binding regulatory protein [Runella sp. MFBS21]MDF7816268.1 Spx/MgsR family RNA polymerase-binding regulatory protein [Runella sp. MFBS21]
MVTIYGIPNCDTIKKTLTALKENHINYTFHDYKKEGISRQKLAEWLTQQPQEILINRAGTTWKKLTDDPKNSLQNPEDIITLMQENTSLIKRPIIEKEGKIIVVGWKPDYIHQL